MTILALGTIALPPALHWADEWQWSPVVQTTDYTLTGAVVVEEHARPAGRPITLEGGRANGQTWTWLTRGDFATLNAAGEVPGTIWTLTLADARTFRVTARRDGPGGAWLEGYPRAAFGDIPPPNPGDDWRYILTRVRLLEVPE